MIRTRFRALLWRILFCSLVIFCAIGPEVWAGPYSDGISDGIAYNDPDILGWATDCTGQRSANASFGTWEDAVGPAPGLINDVVSLGDNGYALLTFDVTIADGPGADLAVFENAFQVGSNVFAELAFVEVSSDGIHFVAFPAYSFTPELVPPEGTIDPTDVHNLAGKHVNNQGTSLGTPFDLARLSDREDVQSGLVNLYNINYVKIVDVVGDGLTLDSEGRPIYDPHPTDDPYWGTGGFDLDAVAVLNKLMPGDVDCDGSVGTADLTTIISNWGLAGATRANGDLDGDGTVEGKDYCEVLSYWGTGSPAEPPSNIPTPATLWLLLLAAGPGLWARARERISNR